MDKLGFGKSFLFRVGGPRPIPKSVIIDERGSKISEDLIYFCDSGSPFSEKMCQNCCKGCQILMSRYLLAAASGSSRQPAEVPGASAARDLPSTRAGGQDDVSSQANSLKLISSKNFYAFVKKLSDSSRNSSTFIENCRVP